MSWMQTYTGRAFDLRTPRAEDVCLDDIAHALARINRYNGHTRIAYSVAEHSLLVTSSLMADYSDHALALAGLLHDAAEAYVGDLIFPLYQALSPAAAAEIRTIMGGVEAVILEALRIPLAVDLHAPLVREYDRRILLNERAALLTEPPPLRWLVDGLRPLNIDTHEWGWEPERAEKMWISMYKLLMQLVVEKQP